MSTLSDAKDAMSSSSPDPGATSRRNEVLSRETDDGSFELILDTGEMRSIGGDEAPTAAEAPVAATRRRSRWLYGGAALAVIVLAGVVAVLAAGDDTAVDQLAEDMPEVPGFRPYAGGAPEASEAAVRRPRTAEAVAEPVDGEVIEPEEEAEGAWALDDADLLEAQAPREMPEPEIPPAPATIDDEAVPHAEEAYAEPEDLADEQPIDEAVDEPVYEDEFVDEEPLGEDYDIEIQPPDMRQLRERQRNIPGLRNAAEPLLPRGVQNLRGRDIAPLIREKVPRPGGGEEYEEPLPEEEYYDEPLPEDELYYEDEGEGY